MNKNVIVGTASGLIAGFVIGNVVTKRAVRYNLRKASPLIQNAAHNLLSKLTEEDMTEERINQILQEEIQFISVAMRQYGVKLSFDP